MSPEFHRWDGAVMSAAYVTRREHFSAAHRLHILHGMKGKTSASFDKCNNAAGHGHNYILDVTVAGQIDPDTGYVIGRQTAFADHSRTCTRQGRSQASERDVDFMRALIPQWRTSPSGYGMNFQPHIPAGKLYRIVLHETEKNSVEYMGE